MRKILRNGPVDAAACLTLGFGTLSAGLAACTEDVNGVCELRTEEAAVLAEVVMLGTAVPAPAARAGQALDEAREAMDRRARENRTMGGEVPDQPRSMAIRIDEVLRPGDGRDAPRDGLMVLADDALAVCGEDADTGSALDRGARYILIETADRRYAWRVDDAGVAAWRAAVPSD